MIKNLKNKFLICLFLLVTVFSVTSSCFAVSNFENIVSVPFTKQQVLDNMRKSTSGVWKPYFASATVDDFDMVVFYLNNLYYIVVPCNHLGNSVYSTTFTTNVVGKLDSSGNLVLYTDNTFTTKCDQEFLGMVYKDGSFYATSSNTTSPFNQGESLKLYPSTDTYFYLTGNTFYLTRCSTFNLTTETNISIYNSDGSVLYDANVPVLSVDVVHEFQNDTSAKVNFTVNNAPNGAILKYSLTGVEISTDLTAPIQLRNPVTYTPGITNLIVKPNTKVYWALYDSNGDVLDTNVYQVPEYDSVIENADKSIEYSVTYNEDNSLATLTVNVINGEFSDKLYYTENGMVSNDYAGKQLFPASKTLQIDHNCNMHIILYDPFDNLITAEYVTINQIGSIPEQNFKVDVTTGDKTVYVRPRLYNVLQSRFYSIEYDVVLDTFTASKDIELHQDGVYVGKVTDTSQTHTCGSDSELKFYQNIGTSNITVTFRIINAETGETCITRTVSFKIGLDDESTGVTDSTTNGVTDNSFITSGTDSNYSGVANMGIDDYYNMVNTNNTAWSFLKVILNSLPNWITLPLSLLIFGVVTITLYRFIRGA